MRCGIVSTPSAALDGGRHDHRAELRARRRVVVDVDVAGRARLADRLDRLEQPRVVARRAAGRSAPRRRSAPRGGRGRAPSPRRSGAIAATASVRSTTSSGADGTRSSSRAARMEAISIGVVPQQPPMMRGAEAARLGGELGEVLGRRVGVDDPSAGEAREAEVRQRGQRRAVAAHLLERRQRRLEPRAVVRAHRRHVEPAQVLGCRAGPRRPRASPRPRRTSAARRSAATRRCVPRRSPARARRGRRTSRP